MNTKTHISWVIITLIIISATVWYFNNETKRTKDVLVTAEADTKTKLVAAARALNNGQFDEDANAVVHECNAKQQQAFDELLNNLATLTETELAEIETLFTICAYDYPNRSNIMLLRFATLLSAYENYVAALKPLTGEDYQLAKWEALFKAETQQNELANEQVALQLQIIKKLQAGQGVDSPEVKALTDRAQAVAQSAVVNDRQGDAIRSDLLNL